MVAIRLRYLMIGILGVAVAGCGTSSHVRTDPRPAGPAARPVQPPPRPAASGSTYRVVKGDTLYGVAFRNGLDFRDLAQWNRIAPPYTIYPGQVLRLASPGSAVASTPPPAPRPSTAPATAIPKPAPTGPVAAASAGVVTSAPPVTAQHPPMAASGPVSFLWPVDGPLLQRYAAGDPARAGVDIASKAGTAVRAAADGEVVYSGNGLVLYGELIIIKHTNSLLSAYARNGKRLVEEGSKVKAGQPIAEIGAARPSLHFEIRRDGKPVNPLDYLPRR